MLQTYVVIYTLQLSIVLLGPQYIRQTVLIGLHTVVRIHALCHLVCFFGKGNNQGCQPFDVDLYDGISVLIVHRASCFLDVQ
jgi:hypothetical protein